MYLSHDRKSTFVWLPWNENITATTTSMWMSKNWIPQNNDLFDCFDVKKDWIVIVIFYYDQPFSWEILHETTYVIWTRAKECCHQSHCYQNRKYFADNDIDIDSFTSFVWNLRRNKLRIQVVASGIRQPCFIKNLVKWFLVTSPCFSLASELTRFFIQNKFALLAIW